MNAFKDAVANDVKNVFLDMEYFADMHEINGVERLCVIDSDLTSEVQKTLANPLEGVFMNVLTIYLDARDMPQRPVEGEFLTVDGAHFIVRRVSDEMGMYVIVAEVNDQ